MRQILLVALLSWFSIPAAALSQELGEFVVVVAETAQLREGSKVVGTLNRGDQLRIDGIENRRYLALSTWDYTHGWIDTKDVIPLDEGVEFFTQAIQRNPTPVDFAARGLVWVITGETDKAIADFDKAIEMQPAFVTAYLRRAIAFANKDDFDKAVNDCTEAIRLDPSNAEPYCSRGAVLSAKGDHDKALRDFDQAVRLNPNSGAVHFSRGAELQRNSRLSAALTEYDRVIELNPNLSDAYVWRGTIHQVKGKPEKALADFNEAIRLNPTDLLAHDNRAKLLHFNGDLDKAIDDYSVLVRLDPMNPTNYFNRASVWQDKGNFAKALSDYDETIRIEPTYGLAFYKRAWIRAGCPDDKCRDGAKAIDDATEARELNPSPNSDDLDVLAAAYAEAGQFEKAVEWQQEAIDLAFDVHKKDYRSRLKLYQARKPFRGVRD